MIHLFIALVAGTASGATYHITPTSTMTIQQAVDAAVAGDTISLAGGTYMLDTSIRLVNSGAEGNPIRLFAKPGEEVVLDFSNNPMHANPIDHKTPGATIEGDLAPALGLYVRGDWWHVKGLTIQNAPYMGAKVLSSHNVFENMVFTRNKGTGLEICGEGTELVPQGGTPGHNLVLNCDSYLNFDSQMNGENADGFACKYAGMTGVNTFRGCRAWKNADDGMDFWHASQPVLVEDSWVFDNGYKQPEFNWSGRPWRGDGMGFKLGQDSSRITLNNVLAFGNKGFGIDDNGNRNPAGCIINNATLINNAKGGNPIQISLRDGMPHTVTNTRAFDADGSEVTQLSEAVNHTNNSWNDDTSVTVTHDDLANLNMTQLLAEATATRNPDGCLPRISLHPAPDSDQ